MKIKIILQIIYIMLLFSVNIMAEIPIAPTNAGTYEPTDSTIRLSFKDMADDEDGFKIYYQKKLLAELKAKEEIGEYKYITLSELIPNTLYTIHIVAFNSNGESSPLIKSFRTKPTPNPPINPNAPAKPTNVGTYKTTSSSTRMSFLDNATDEEGFKVYYNDEIIASVNAKQGSGKYQYINVEGLEECKLYKIRLVAYNSFGESDATIKSFRTMGCNQPPIITSLHHGLGNEIVGNEDMRYPFVVDVIEKDGTIVDCEWRIDGKLYSNGCMVEGYYRYGTELVRQYATHIMLPSSSTTVDYNISCTVTDNDGATATKSKIFKKLGDDTQIDIQIKPLIKRMTVGESIRINANILPVGYIGYYRWGFAIYTRFNWSASGGIVHDDRKSMIMARGNKNADIIYEATEEGNQTLTLDVSSEVTNEWSASNSKTINIEVIQPSYTKDIEKKIVIDNIRGLIWQDSDEAIKKPFVTEENYNNGNLRTYNGDTADTYCKNLEWGGYSDWRLPTFEEVTSYISRNDSEYWSSTTNKDLDNGNLIGLNVNSPFSSWGQQREPNSELLVKCVR